MSHPPLSTTPSSVITAIEMVAAGHTQAQVAKVLGCSVRTVGRILSEPAAKQALADLRLVLRAKTLQGVHVVTPALHVWLKEVIEGKVDARDADMLSRALLNLEKTAASASGENRPQAQVAPTINVAIAPGWVKPKPGQATVVQTEPAQHALPPTPHAIPRDL